MTDQIKHTAAELAAHYNELTGKSIKPTSYSKAKLIDMISAIEHDQPAGEPILLADVARELGINPKLARARFRKLVNDKVRTQYVFPANAYDAIKAIITPGKLPADFAIPATIA